MKRILLSVIAACALAGAAVPAFAQGYRSNEGYRSNDGYRSSERYRSNDWQPLSMRQNKIEQRIDQGLASGQLTRREARGLRNEFDGLLRLEARYRADGLSYNERTDLQRRYDTLATRVRFEKHDNQTQYYPAGR
jgi:hypothetical protein